MHDSGEGLVDRQVPFGLAGQLFFSESGKFLLQKRHYFYIIIV
jgi:hypothetical protein